jgi:signal transduction histidine kinase
VRTSLSGLSRSKLRLWLGAFFLALAIPTGVLIVQAYSQLKWEAFHQYQGLAEELATRIDDGFRQRVRAEEARAFTDYAFLVVAGDPTANFLQRSPLSNYPVEGSIPGLIGYFQVDADGALSTPLLPQPGIAPGDYGIAGVELDERRALAGRIRRILSENRLVQAGVGAGRKQVSEGAASMELSLGDAPQVASAERNESDGYSRKDSSVGWVEMDEAASPSDRGGAPPQPPMTAQAAFDRLNAPAASRAMETKQKASGKLGRVEDLKLDYQYQGAPMEQAMRQLKAEPEALAEKRVRKERSALPEAQVPLSELPLPEVLGDKEQLPRKAELSVRIFESEVDPMEFSLLDSGHFVLFRKVWRDGQRYIQGLLLEQRAFLGGLIEQTFRDAGLSRMSELAVAYQGNLVYAFTGQSGRGYLSSAEELSGALLYQTRLSAPFSDLQLIFSVTHLPEGPGGRLVAWVALILVLVLCGGFYLLYRLGAKQIDLARQQQDFVSAVSHELKTPLTSIRMYGEMLREGWAPEEKKKSYYEFIHDESERLSRLISNVLQLARMTRNEVRVDIKPVAVAELVDGIRSRVSSPIERAGFRLNLECDPAAAESVVAVDRDAFTQIVINLVDNAIKFAAKADTKVVDVACRLQGSDRVVFSVRDYGPGVPRDQMKKIFKLFYRSESELTRETLGTGIGLALVRQLAKTMNAKVDVLNRGPGAEFLVVFPRDRALH